MKQFAVIGLGFFGVRVLEELLQYDVDVMVLDRDAEAIETYKDVVGAAYVVDIIREDIIKESSFLQTSTPRSSTSVSILKRLFWLPTI